MTEVRALKKVRELIARPYGWTQGRFSTTGKRGVSYCLLGAIRHVNNEAYFTKDPAPTITSLQARLEQCIQKIHGNRLGVPTFNDTEGRTKKEVLGVIDCAIKSAESEGL